MIWDAMLERGIAIPPFSSDEMSHLLAYLYFIEYYPEGRRHQARSVKLFVSAAATTATPLPRKRCCPKTVRPW